MIDSINQTVKKVYNLNHWKINSFYSMNITRFLNKDEFNLYRLFKFLMIYNVNDTLMRYFSNVKCDTQHNNFGL